MCQLGEVVVPRLRTAPRRLPLRLSDGKGQAVLCELRFAAVHRRLLGLAKYSPRLPRLRHVADLTRTELAPSSHYFATRPALGLHEEEVVLICVCFLSLSCRLCSA